MSQMSDYLENALINHVFRNTAMPAPVTVYIALFTSNPTDAAIGTEVTGGAYARQTIAFGSPTNGSTNNSAQVSFPVATASWGLVTHAAVFDAGSGGNMLVHGPLAGSKQIDIDDQFVFRVGNFVVNFQ